MRTPVLLLAALLALAGAALAEAPLPADPLLRETLAAPGGPVTRLHLPGGPTVLLQPDGGPAVAVVLAVPAGSRQDPGEKGGTAHLLEHLVYRATPKFSAGRLPLELEAAGARSGARTTPETSVFWEVVPAARVDLALAVEADRLDGLTFSTRDLERERSLLLAEVAALEARPVRQAEAWLRRTLHPGQPEEALLPAGTPEEIRSIQAEDLRALYQRSFRRDRAVLALVGGFQPEAVEARLRELFPSPAPSPAAPDPAASPAPAPAAGPGERPASSGGVLLMALDAPAVEAPDFAALVLLEAALAEGSTSRLARALQGQARVLPDPSLQDGLHLFTLQLLSGSRPSAVETAVRREFARLGQEELPQAELESARRRALARFYLEWQDLARRGLALAEAEGGQSLEDLLSIPERLGSLKPTEVREAARRLLHEARVRSYLPPEGDPPLSPDLLPTSGEAFAGPDPGPAPFVRRRLENGMTVLVWPDHALPTVTVRGYLQGGALLDPPGKSGLTSLSARLLGRGTESRTGEAFTLDLEDRGMRLAFRGDRQVVRIEGWCLREDLPRLAGLLADALRHPRPGPDALGRAREEALAESRRAEASPFERALTAFMAALYPAGHPYARTAGGDEASLQALGAEEALTWLRRISQPDRLVLAFAGDVSEAQVMAALRPELTSWFGEESSPRTDVDDVPEPAPSVQRLPCPGPEALVLAGHPGPSRRDPDYHAFNLLNQVLGGNPASSRLAVRIRDDEALGSSVSSRLVPLAGPVPWGVVMQVRPEAVDRSVAVVKEEMQRLRDEAPAAAEVQRAVAALTGRLRVQLADPAARADLLCALEFHHLSDAWADGFAGVYERITPTELRETARRRLRPDRLVVVVAAPETPGAPAAGATPAAPAGPARPEAQPAAKEPQASPGGGGESRP